MKIEQIKEQNIQGKIITIDGPSGVGKGTLACLLAQKLGYALLDSGAIYRLAALHIINTDLVVEDHNALYNELKKLPIRFDLTDKGVLSYLNNQEVTVKIREEKTGMMASKIAKIQKVREALLQRQKDFSKNVKGLVADGRDMGTVVFPEASHKFFLEADSAVRAKRRCDELKLKGESVDFDAVLKQLETRDDQDRNRTVSPLKPANDAVIVDTSYLDIQGVFTSVLAQILAPKFSVIMSKIQNWQQAYYDLLIQTTNKLNYVPEFLNQPNEVSCEKTRLLCQTRGIYYLLAYAKLSQNDEIVTRSNNQALALYHQTKKSYFNEIIQDWGRFPNHKESDNLYEYAFLLFALSHLYQTFPQKKIKDDIKQVNQLIQHKFIVDDFDGLKDLNGVIEQNALMHLFEGYLSAYNYTKESCFKLQAESLYQYVIATFFNDEIKLIQEYSNNVKIQVFEPGHSFEWGCLIVEAQSLDINVACMPDHQALFRSAKKQGINPLGLVKASLNNDEAEVYRIWPMLEYMRYLAMTNDQYELSSALVVFEQAFIENNLPIEYVNTLGKGKIDRVKSTTGYHLINCWQYVVKVK